MGDEYDYGVVHGTLKLKKDNGLFKKSSSDKKKKKKTKKGSKSKKEEDKRHTEQEDIHANVATKTEAEKKYDDVRMKRRLERIDKLAEKSYRDRVKEFNEKLEREPEHHEMPKVGPG